jgi:glutathione S-transferase
MKLYFTPGTCSLAPHIALREAGLAFELERVSLSKKQTASGADFLAINPKGYVPVLELDDGSRLTEVAVITQYIADQRPDTGLAPPAGTMERYRLQEWLAFISSEIHKTFSPLFNAKLPDDQRAATKEKLGGRFDLVNQGLEGKSFLMGETFTVADAYLFAVLGWTKHVAIDLEKWPALAAYVARIGARPAVVAALGAERPPKP